MGGVFPGIHGKFLESRDGCGVEQIAIVDPAFHALCRAHFQEMAPLPDHLQLFAIMTDSDDRGFGENFLVNIEFHRTDKGFPDDWRFGYRGLARDRNDKQEQRQGYFGHQEGAVFSVLEAIGMKRPDPIETTLDALREATDLTPFLRHRNYRVVAKAAEKAARMTAAVAPELVDAFRRLIKAGDAVKQDPGCVAKVAIAKALVELDDGAAEVYFAGARCVQLEPGWGEAKDTSAELRGICAIGLARMGHPEALLEVVRLLNDREPETRIGAIRGLADSGKPEAELVLRYKADCGDKRPEVVGECFAALLRLGPPTRAIPFVAEFMEHGNEEAAVALGESRLAEAWPALREAFGRSSIQSAILLAMALLRHDDAIAFLFDRAENERERVAAVAIEALASYRGDPALRARMEQLVAKRNVPALRKAFENYWGDRFVAG